MSETQKPWKFRTRYDDMTIGEINLAADWSEGIPVVCGQKIGNWTAPETRKYSVQEIKDAQSQPEGR